jgi:hypothetical protein
MRSGESASRSTKQRDVRLLTLDLPPKPSSLPSDSSTTMSSRRTAPTSTHHFKDNSATPPRYHRPRLLADLSRHGRRRYRGTGTYRQHMMRHTFSCPDRRLGAGISLQRRTDRPFRSPFGRKCSSQKSSSRPSENSHGYGRTERSIPWCFPNRRSTIPRAAATARKPERKHRMWYSRP